MTTRRIRRSIGAVLWWGSYDACGEAFGASAASAGDVTTTGVKGWDHGR